MSEGSVQLEFNAVDGAADQHVHVYLRKRFIAMIVRQPGGGYLLASQHFAGGILHSDEEAREVVRMWADRAR